MAKVLGTNNNKVYQTPNGTVLQANEGGGGSTSWGNITGTLSDQTDLQSALNAKGTYSKPSGGIPASDLASGVIPDISGKEDTSNKVTSISSSSTDTQYPSAKCVYDALQTKMDKVTITVTCVTQDGVTVTGQTVTVRQGDSASSPVYVTLAYNGQPVSFDAPKNFSYYISVSDTLPSHFSPTTAQGIATTSTSVVLTYNDVTTITTYADIQSALNAGATTALIGVEIADTWVDKDGTSYSDPTCIVAVQTVEDENGNTHTGAIMQRKYAGKDSINFDGWEKVIATGTYQSGLYYYLDSNPSSFSVNNITLLTEGTDYQVGDTITGTVYVNSIRDTTRLICAGYNNYKYSAIRQYLNSNAGVGLWWTSQHTGDGEPSKLNNARGYLAGCSTDMKNAVKKIKITINSNTVTDGGAIESMYDTVWLPSWTEMYGVGNADEGTYFPLIKERMGLDSPSNSANAGRIFYAINNHNYGFYCLTRSCNRGVTTSYKYIGGDGRIGDYGGYVDNHPIPTFAVY